MWTELHVKHHAHNDGIEPTDKLSKLTIDRYHFRPQSEPKYYIHEVQVNSFNSGHYIGIICNELLGKTI